MVRMVARLTAGPKYL